MGKVQRLVRPSGKAYTQVSGNGKHYKFIYREDIVPSIW